MQNTDWQVLYQETKPFNAWVETIVLTLLGWGLGYGFMPDAAYFSVPGFSWLMLGPLLSGLRYGFVHALGSVLLVVGIAVLAHQYRLAWAQAFNMPLLMGLLLVAFVAGEFRDYWYRRLKRLNAVAHYLDERLIEVSRAFNMLKHSHDRLEQLMVSRTSLRDSLFSVRRQILLSSADQEGKALGMLILNTLAEFGFLQGASLHAINPQTQQINKTPMAVLGDAIALDIDNPIIQKMLADRQTVCLKLDLIVEHAAEILVAIPLIDVYGKMWGVVAVNKLPFRAFTESNIQLLSILSGYIGDLVRIRMQLKKYCGDENALYFYVQVVRCLQDTINHNLSACLLGLVCKEPKHNALFMRLVNRYRRDLEQLLALTNEDGHSVVLIIFPLTNLSGIESYLKKFRFALNDEFKLDASCIDVHQLGLTADMDLAHDMHELSKKLRLNPHFFAMKPNV